MAHAGTPTDLAQRPATSTTNGLWQALLAAVVLFALVVGIVVVGTNLAAKGSAVPAEDRSYDQIEAQRGATILTQEDRSYDRIEQLRGGAILAPAVHYPDVSYDQNRLSARTISGIAPDNGPRRIQGHRGAMIDQ